jgi:hypothetical protein
MVKDWYFLITLIFLYIHIIIIQNTENIESIKNVLKVTNTEESKNKIIVITIVNIDK